MFTEPKFRISTDKRIYFSGASEIVGNMAKPWMKERLNELCSEGEGAECRVVLVEREIPAELAASIPNYEKNEEGFVISVGETTYIYADEKALHPAFATLAQLCEEGGLYETLLWDRPFCAMRGYRLYVPAREQTEQFKRTVDMLEYYRFNTVIIEVGGAMEYKSHPEINECWVEYCADMRAYSGRSLEIQERTYDFQKNSIHADNCLGGYLPQEELRELIEYCRSRGIEPIPEMPSLSHSDYLLMPYPELREREEDAYPDTYCPQNPKCYELLFDLLKEVIDVFNPSIINIGHDEYYSIGLCERCKNIPAEELFAGDIIKIHDFLAEHGVRTMMWGDKLLNITSPEYGCETGGAEIRRLSLTSNPKEYYIPATYRARDLIPKDILVLNWVGEFGKKYDNDLLECGFEVVFSNLNIYNITEWNPRIRAGIGGGFVSNWGSVDVEAMQRNGQMMMLLSAAYAFWDSEYDSPDNDALFERASAECVRWYRRGIKHPITVTHTTDRLMKKYVFYDGIVVEDELWRIGDYEVCYADGTKALLPVHYGFNISNKHLHYAYNNSGLYETVGAASAEKRGCEPHNPVTYTVTWFHKPPETVEQKVDYELWYTCVYENPHPEKEITEIVYRPRPEPLRNPDAWDYPVVAVGNGVTTAEIKW